jgi:hypothetical protein
MERSRWRTEEAPVGRTGPVVMVPFLVGFRSTINTVLRYGGLHNLEFPVFWVAAPCRWMQRGPPKHWYPIITLRQRKNPENHEIFIALKTSSLLATVT